MARPERIMVNFRIPRELLAEIDGAAARAGLNRTEWVTSTLTVACREGLRAATAAVAARAGGYLLVDGCAHPRPRRAWGRDGLVCRDCGALLERTSRGA